MKLAFFCAMMAVLMAMLAPESYAGMYCNAPTAPTMMETKPVPPTQPYCLNSLTGSNNCSASEIDYYNRDVDRYNGELQNYQEAAREYIAELNRYVNDANQYAKCEVNAL